MAKYIKINDCMDIIEVNDEIIGEKHYCWNCEIKSLEQLEAIEIRLWEIQNSMEDSEIKDEIIKIILNIEDRLIYIREEKYTEPFWEDKWDWFDKECGRIFGCKFEDYYKVKD